MAGNQTQGKLEARAFALQSSNESRRHSAAFGLPHMYVCTYLYTFISPEPASLE